MTATARTTTSAVTRKIVLRRMFAACSCHFFTFAATVRNFNPPSGAATARNLIKTLWRFCRIGYGRPRILTGDSK
ncbi:MAG: hypothetical protein HZT43_11950 [Exiguobacterium profundum]|nr:MAG: hypothetical protein HZT43_11950 [Exiguobacterium profundum]